MSFFCLYFFMFEGVSHFSALINIKYKREGKKQTFLGLENVTFCGYSFGRRADEFDIDDQTKLDSFSGSIYTN